MTLVATSSWQDLLTELGVSSEKEKEFFELWNSVTADRDTSYDIDNLVEVLRKELNLALPEDYSLLMGFVKRFKQEPIYLGSFKRG